MQSVAMLMGVRHDGQRLFRSCHLSMQSRQYLRCTLSVACCPLHVVRCMLSVACCTLHVVDCMLYVACCPLHVVRCILSVACCTLHVVCCTLHVGVARGFRRCGAHCRWPHGKSSVSLRRSKHRPHLCCSTVVLCCTTVVPCCTTGCTLLHHGLYPVATHGPKEGLCAAHERVAKVFYLGAKLLELFIIGRSRQDRRLCEPTARRRCNAARCNALQHSATCCNPTPAPACASRTTAVGTSERAREVHRERVRGASHAPESAGLLRRQLRRGDAELQERHLRLGLFRLHLRVPRRRLECLRPEATRLEHAMATAAEQPPAVH